MDVHTKFSHYAELLMLGILHISAWACLIRSDFNFVFIIFSYFIFINNREKVAFIFVFYMIIALIILDLFFFMFVPRTWMSVEENNNIWNSMKGLRGFAIFLSVLILLLKGPLVYCLWMHKQHLEKDVIGRLSS